MDQVHAMWESLLFQWLPGKQPLPSPFEAFGSVTTGAHLMWSPHLTSSSLFPGPRRLEGQSRRRGPQIVVDHLHVNTETRPGSGFNIEGVRCTEVPLCVHIWARVHARLHVYMMDCVWACVCTRVCFHVCAWHDPVHLNYTAAKLLQMF